MPGTDEDSNLRELIKYLKANLMLSLRESSDEESKPEILLHRAGFTQKEIADLLGKNYEAVRKTFSRAKKDNKEGEA